MSKKLFVRNLPFSLEEADLSTMFSEVGVVAGVKMPLDRETGRKRGFAFVEMSSAQDALRAIERLNSHYVSGREIFVELAQDRRAA
jgi:RNA recognition motif-containing protein